MCRRTASIKTSFEHALKRAPLFLLRDSAWGKSLGARLSFGWLGSAGGGDGARCSDHCSACGEIPRGKWSTWTGDTACRCRVPRFRNAFFWRFGACFWGLLCQSLGANIMWTHAVHSQGEGIAPLGRGIPVLLSDMRPCSNHISSRAAFSGSCFGRCGRWRDRGGTFGDVSAKKGL